jgi:hypothetical protein
MIAVTVAVRANARASADERLGNKSAAAVPMMKQIRSPINNVLTEFLLLK